jgi:hypothetical protein
MADTRPTPGEPHKDDAFIRDNVRVCPLARNTTHCDCWWVRVGRPDTGLVCACQPPPELWGQGQ